VERVDRFLLDHDLAQPGDHIVILMGSPLFQQAKTNVLRVHRITEA
jgi:pyruvate kinase